MQMVDMTAPVLDYFGNEIEETVWEVPPEPRTGRPGMPKLDDQRQPVVNRLTNRDIFFSVIQQKNGEELPVADGVRVFRLLSEVATKDKVDIQKKDAEWIRDRAIASVPLVLGRICELLGLSLPDEEQAEAA